jgi:hypothetical protein
MRVKSLTNAISKKDENGTLKVSKIKIEKVKGVQGELRSKRESPGGDTYTQTLELLND